MIICFLSLILGLILLMWSADRFVDGASSVSRHFGMSPLFIGMIIIGFGTSIPEMIVSVLSSYQGNPGIALGNAYGSNITNIALILGLTALIRPINVHSQVLRKELPILSMVTMVSIYFISDFELSRKDAFLLLLIFLCLMFWTIMNALKKTKDSFGEEVKEHFDKESISLKKSCFYLVIGLVLLIVSSRLLVWGAVEIARSFGVSDIIIGLTVVAIGTSLPEFASSVVAARKGESDMALGNILGSNLFNTLVVVGLSGVIHPMSISHDVLKRDVFLMAMLTFVLFIFGYGFRGKGRINRIEGFFLFLSYVFYTFILAKDLY